MKLKVGSYTPICIQLKFSEVGVKPNEKKTPFSNATIVEATRKQYLKQMETFIKHTQSLAEMGTLYDVKWKIKIDEDMDDNESQTTAEHDVDKEPPSKRNRSGLSRR
jgi:hypothetical protein